MIDWHYYIVTYNVKSHIDIKQKTMSIGSRYPLDTEKIADIVSGWSMSGFVYELVNVSR